MTAATASPASPHRHADHETVPGPGRSRTVSQFLLNGLDWVAAGRDFPPVEAERFLTQVAETARRTRAFLDIALKECPA